MRIIEQFTRGKTGDEKANEDRLAVTDDFVAVFDGVTSRPAGDKGLSTLNGVSTGKFAAMTLAAELEKLTSDIDARTAVEHLSKALLERTRAAAKAEAAGAPAESWSWPGSALLVYSRARKEIWRVADSPFLIDGKAHYKTLPQERNWAQLRRSWLCAKIARGIAEKDLSEHDNSWELLAPLIMELRVFANYDGPFGYGVINGSPVPAAHIEVYPAAGAKEIVLASDGYPEVFGSLAETELYLQQVLTEDPLMFRVHPQVKGMRKGFVSFDDRTYVRFQP